MIGVFDSGLGGLTVLKEIKKQLPGYSTIYLGDLAHLPYGTKSAESINQFSKEIVNFLIKKGAEIIVVACNTASATALPSLKKSYKVPIIGVIEGAAKTAIKNSKNKKIGVIGTPATCNSHAYKKALQELGDKVEIFELPTPLLVPLVEENWIKRAETRRIARYYLRNLKDKHTDTLILGCTHYPIIAKLISQVIGQKVKIIDPASGVIDSLKKILEKKRIRSASWRMAEKKKPTHQILLTDLSQNFEKVSEEFLGEKVKDIKKIEL